MSTCTLTLPHSHCAVVQVPNDPQLNPPGGDQWLSTQHFNQHRAVENVLLWWLSNRHIMHAQLILESARCARLDEGPTAQIE